MGIIFKGGSLWRGSTTVCDVPDMPKSNQNIEMSYKSKVKLTNLKICVSKKDEYT